MTTTDRDLIDAALAGRTSAFGQLVERYQQRLVFSLTKLTGSHEEALDQAQEAFLLAYQKLDSFRGDAHFYSWLFRIAYHCAMNHHRRRKSTVSLEAVRETAGFDPVDGAQLQDQGQTMMDQEDLALLSVAMDDLTDEHREVITLKDLSDLSYEQIADVLRCPIGTVRSRLHRARLELKNAFLKRSKVASTFSRQGAPGATS